TRQGYLYLVTITGEGAHVDLVLPRLIGRECEPAAVAREGRELLLEGAGDHHPERSMAGTVQDGNIGARIVAQIVAGGDEGAAIPEPVTRVGQVNGGVQRLRRFGAPRALPVEPEVPGPDRGIGDEPAVRSPGGVVAVAIEGRAGEGAGVQ